VRTEPLSTRRTYPSQARSYNRAAVRRLAVLLLGALLVGGCGGGDGGSEVRQGALTIYTSLPRHGDSATAGSAVLQGERLALADHRGHAGGRPIKLVPLDSSKPDGHTWDPDLVEKNADRATDDPSAIAYVGELDAGGSAISVPVTNDKHIVQLSPLDSLTSLTMVQPGGPRGGPERYYPRGRRTFARLVPHDLSQATALVDWAKADGATRIAIVHDDQLAGRSIASQVVFVADARAVKVVTVKEVGTGDEPKDYEATAKALAGEKERPDAVVYAGLVDATAEPLLGAVQKALPGARIYAAGLPPERPLTGVGPVNLIAATAPADEYPARAQRVLKRLSRNSGGAPQPAAAIYGYESMRLVLEAIDRAEPHAGDRAAVARELLRPGPRAHSLLGALAITNSGDVADQRVAAYRREGEHLTYLGLREVRPPELPRAPGDPGS
jgi:branched-chain amino acid transport system substrate-binding protein